MNKTTIVLFLIALTGLASFGEEKSRLEQILSQRGVNFGREAERAAVVRQLKAAERAARREVAAKAKTLGVPMVAYRGNREYRLIGFNKNRPRYEVDRMVNAAISSNARVLQSVPYALDGSGWTVGIWEGGVARTTHQEFDTGSGSRVAVMDGSTSVSNHATHVTGIIAAAGLDPAARGIANALTINSYNSSNLYSELTNRSASGSGQQATKIYLSNHSYGITGGWGSGKTWAGVGTDQNSVDPDLGLYSNICVLIDEVVENHPYHLLFWACGNERGNQPVDGDQVTLGGETVTYDSAIHPPSNTVYKNGYDTIPGRALAKNLVAVGCTNDAVSGGARNPASATIASFSSWGPADDGRIKPDLVTNGVSVYSASDSSDSAYTSLQGTSMSSPNACGTAALLVEQYGQLFGGASMAACTLKGLMIHTADDLGTAGPDYINGWGLVNGQKAADLLISHEANPLRQELSEDQITDTDPNKIITFDWNGVSAIRATLCWTDPAGVAESSVDDRSPDLVNDLNLKIIAPDGTEYFPFVMPYVGDWTNATLDDPATTGVNTVDNVEQVLVDAPGQAGTWTVEVTYAGTLRDGVQDYGLILDGASGLVPDSSSVISPNGGERLVVEGTYDITWASNVAGNVKIDLFKGGAFHSTLSANEVNDGSFSWTIASTTPKGSDYTIRISSVTETSNFDESDGSFFIDPLPSLEAALDTTGVVWTSSGNADWFQQANVTRDGVDAAQSGDLQDGQNSSLNATFVGPGTLTFWWKVSSELDWDYLRFYLNGSEQGGALARISGEVDWVQKTIPIAAGSQNLRWSFTKDGSVSDGFDAGWVDQVVYTPDSPPDIAIAYPPGTSLADGGAAVDFGGVALGGSSAPRTFTITNSGSSSLTGLGLSKSGNHSGDFVLGVPGATTLAPGADTTFTAIFNPSGTGPRNATISVASNDPDENPFEINVTGEGLPEATLSVTGGDLVSTGQVGGPFTPESLIYTIANTGSTTMTWAAAQTRAWVTLSPAGGTLPPGGDTTVTASINDTANGFGVGGYSDVITFTNTTNGLGNTTRDVTLTIQAPVFDQTLIYEPFDDPDPTLAGNSPGSGLAGFWSGSGGVVPGGLNYGVLPAGTGGAASLSNHSGHVVIGSGLADEGLLTDGADLWFSVIVRTGSDIATNGDFGFCLGSEPIDRGNNLPMTNGGMALGFTFKNNQLRASHWSPALIRSSSNNGNGASAGSLYLVVGKFSWGASSETIEIYNVPTDLTLGTPVSTYTTATNLNQATFDTLSFAAKPANPGHLIDEIRFGSSYEAVVGLGSPGVDHFEISAITSSQVVGQAISNVTITARDASDQTVTDFTGTVTFGGTAGVTGTSANFTGGVLTGVIPAPQNTGSDLTLTVDDGEGHSGSANLTVISVYEAWTGGAFANPFTSTPEGDNPDNDVMTNLQEFAFGLDPTDPDITAMSYQVDGDVIQTGPPTSLVLYDEAGQVSEIRAIFIRRRDHVAAGLTYTVEFTADLESWTASAGVPERLTGETSAGEFEVMAVIFPATVPLQGGGSAAPAYFKVGVSRD